MRKTVSLLLGVSVVLPQPAMADDDAEVLAPLAYFGLKAADGKTTAAEGAGQLEVAALMDSVAQTVAMNIVTAVGTAAGTERKSVFLAMGQEPFDISTYAVVKARVERVAANIKIVAAQCPTPAPQPTKSPGQDDGPTEDKGESGGKKADLSSRAIISDFLGLLRSDREVRSVTAPTATSMLRSAIMAQTIAGMKWRSVTDLQAPVNFGEGSLLQSFDSATIAANEAIAECSTNKASVDSLKGYAAQLASLAEPGEKGAPSQLERALALDGIPLDQTLILRVDVEQSGGTMVNTSNIWTTLGLEGLRFGGGLLASYRLIDPKDQTVIASGTQMCLSPIRGFSGIHRAVSRQQTEHDTKGRCSAN